MPDAVALRARNHGSVRWASSSKGMPMPVSTTSTTTWPPSSRVRTVTEPPRGVYFTRVAQHVDDRPLQAQRVAEHVQPPRRRSLVEHHAAEPGGGPEQVDGGTDDARHVEQHGPGRAGGFAATGWAERSSATSARSRSALRPTTSSARTCSGVRSPRTPSRSTST